MFRLEVFVDDKKLSYVLWALSGHVIEMKPPQPVANASAKNGKVHADVPGGDKAEMFIAELRKLKVKEFRPKHVMEWCEKIGLSRKSYSNLLSNTVAKGLVSRRRTGKGNAGFTYTVKAK